jgi:hypothetical protein
MRLFVVLSALLLAMVPAVTQAAPVDELLAKQKANTANDIARCVLAAKGEALPGRIAASTPEAAAACAKAGAVGANSEVRALSSLPANTKIKCAYPGGVPKVAKLVLDDYLIAKAKAEAKDKAAPVPSQEILSLLACN